MPNLSPEHFLFREIVVRGFLENSAKMKDFLRLSHLKSTDNFEYTFFEKSNTEKRDTLRINNLYQAAMQKNSNEHEMQFVGLK
jgi:hypothetical protein